MKFIRLYLPLLLLVVAACSAPVKGLFPPDENETAKSIFLVSHGWHAGIVVKRTDIPDGVWPEQNDFPESEYLEVGWGDRRFYQGPEPNLWTVVKAALLPTSSVLHIVGFSGPVPEYFPASEVIKIELSNKGFEKVCRYIADSYAKDESGNAIPLGPGLYGNSRFYLSGETYHGFKTCNVWVAKALRGAGCPITPALSIRVESLLSKARTFGTVIQSKPTPP